MIVLALDLGVSTGWALSHTGVVESGVQEFALKRGESGGMRYLRFRRWLEDLAPWPQPAMGLGPAVLVVYELAHHRGGYTTEVHNGLATRVQEYCAVRGWPYQAVHTAMLKKWATGKGNADKSAMLEAVRRQWKADVQDDNEADAMALLQYALANLVPRSEPTEMSPPRIRSEAEGAN